MRRSLRDLALLGLTAALGCSSTPGGSTAAANSSTAPGASSGTAGSTGGVSGSGSGTGTTATAGNASSGAASAAVAGSTGSSTGSAGTCTPCATDANCGAGNHCVQSICLAQGGDGAGCQSASWCLSGVCTNFVCVGGGSSGTSGSADCSPACSTGEYCLNGTCTQKQISGSCTSNDACLGYCAPGMGSAAASSGSGTGGSGSSTTGTSGTPFLKDDAGWPICGGALDCASIDGEYQELISDEGALLDGGTTQLGAMTIVTTLDDGGGRTQVIGDVSLPYLIITYPDSTHVSATGDFNGDGIVDYDYEGSIAGTMASATELTDTTFTGIFNVMDVATFDVSQGPPYGVSESHSLLAVPDGGDEDAGVWVQSWSYQGSSRAETGTGRDCTDADSASGFPDLSGNGVTTLTPVPRSKINIITGSPTQVPGACPPGTAKALVAEFEQAFKNATNCYRAINQDLGAVFADAWATTPMNVACGLTSANCVSTNADTTVASGKYTFNGGLGGLIHPDTLKMNLNPTFLQGADVDGVVETLIHELLHFSGINHSPPREGNPPGHDQVYGCGRYCNLCRSGSTLGAITTPAGFAFDCVDCADTMHQGVCGVGLAEEPECNLGDCSYNKSLSDCSSGSCCETIAESCWADQAIPIGDIGDRNKYLQPKTRGACAHSGCANIITGGAKPSPICAQGDGINLESQTGKSPCTQYPVGLCLSGLQ